MAITVEIVVLLIMAAMDHCANGAIFDIGVFKFNSDWKGKQKIGYMNLSQVEHFVISKIQSRSFLHCITQCRIAEECHAAFYEDKMCVKSRLPSPEMSPTPMEGLEMSISHGWAIIQRRLDGTTDFYRGWKAYVNGFGDPGHNFWLGLETIHQLTNFAAQVELHIYMATFEGEEFFASYDHFHVGDLSSGYALSLSGYSGGTAGDSILTCEYGTANGMNFSTYDNDQDGTVELNCARNNRGAWWYNHCQCSNLNGPYVDGGNADNGRGIIWKTAKGFQYSMKATIMKIRIKYQ